MGGAKVILATAPNAEAISALVEGLGPDSKLIVLGVSFEPIQVGMRFPLPLFFLVLILPFSKLGLSYSIDWSKKVYCWLAFWYCYGKSNHDNAYASNILTAIF